MTLHQFMVLNTCFHIINPTTYVKEKDLLEYDKLGQTKWLVDRFLKIIKGFGNWKNVYN
jgi:hypothetical protein